MSEAQLTLKTAPPRLARALVARPRLERLWSEINDRAAILVTAPQGFGKTTLLAQWRRRWLERGAYVAWVSLDAQDDSGPFTSLLLFALRGATGRDAFGTASAQGALQEHREIDVLTATLAEVATLATPTVVILDDAHRMPQAALRELLPYLVYNAPPNLQFVVGSRRTLELPFGELLANGRLAQVTAGELRLEAEESREFLRARFGSRVGLDDAARLHDLTEGWPLGLQLAAAAIEREPDLHAVIRELGGRRGDVQRFFLESLVSRMSARESQFLVRSAILELFTAELCAAVTGEPDAAGIIAAIARESPVVTEGEQGGWFRLHAMARDFLLGQFDRLPVAERRACYERAAAWYTAHGQLQEAARHAWAAGNEALALDCAAASLRDMGREGRINEARDWMRRLPPTVTARDVRLQLTAAWIRAVGDDPRSVPGLIERIREHPQYDAACACEAAVISAAAANFCDQPGRAARALAEIEPPPPFATALHLASAANSSALLALQSGDPLRARRLVGDLIDSTPRETGTRTVLGIADVIVGLAFNWEGDPVRAEEYLRRRLEAAEREMGRRSVIAALLAAVCAAAAYLQSDIPAAQALLADRLDVIERAGLPDALVLAYRVLADAAARSGDERRALDTLQSLHDIGASRCMPRLQVVSLAEQVRLHVAAGRLETAAEAVAGIEALREHFEQPELHVLLRLFERRLAIADASVRIARGDLAGAEDRLASTGDVPDCLRYNQDVLVHRALRALVAVRSDRPGGMESLLEVASLAELRGMRRFVELAHPGLEELLATGTAPTTPVGSRPARPEVVAAGTPAAGGLLTPKEARILALLAAGMANKEIARAMDIGEQTVKWHLKNVFFKLNAGSRRHAVERARVLGLLGA